MARSQISYGSQGNDVRHLQEFLNTQGYNLTVDGIFGNNTKNAVLKYQKANGLTVDGIVGKNTWGSIEKLSAGTGTSGSTVATPSPTFSYRDYKESDTVTAAGKNAASAADAVKNYGDFAYGNQATIDAVIDKILNREKFSYDLNGDALYQQYKDRYMQQGKMAMQDTMGQAAAMTGGYGNSYAATAGNQVYQAHLEGLNDVIPELQQMAFDRYNQEGQDMLSQYGLLADDRSREYAEWQDGYSRAVAEREYAQGVYDSERSYDYGMWQDGRDFAYGEHRDAITDAQWQAAFDREFDAKYGNTGGGTETETGGNGDTGNTDNTTPNYDNQGYSESYVMQAQEFVGATADGKWGANSAAAAKAKGYNSLQEVLNAMSGGYDRSKNPHISSNGFGGSTYQEACAYVTAKGGSSAGIMTQSEWQRRRHSYVSSGQGGAEVANYSSYKAYLAAITEYLIENK